MGWDLLTSKIATLIKIMEFLWRSKLNQLSLDNLSIYPKQGEELRISLIRKFDEVGGHVSLTIMIVYYWTLENNRQFPVRIFSAIFYATTNLLHSLSL